ncbi:hypothetical protein [Streptomyces sp. NPDC057877]|uniref:hypothetical protein n=1 Tax=Streptomyces sp. NPDC057877 TaxID=3346269 RepID=UPI003683F1E6
MKVTLDDGWTATVTDDPLTLAPRFEGTSLRVMPYTDKPDRERLLLATFGSGAWLWDTPDEVRFSPADRRLVGVEFQLPYESASAEESSRVPDTPPVRPGGLRADQEENFRLEMCAVLCRAPGDTVLTALRDLDVLNEPLDARVGIAPDTALLVQHGTVVGWSLMDPAQHLTLPYSPPSDTPPCDTTRRLLTECLDLITQPLIYDVEDRQPTALARLRATHEALHAQHEDRHRADALHALIATMVDDYTNQ